ncbi:MAG: S24 family peptidase [Lentisphaerota bacterium]
MKVDSNIIAAINDYLSANEMPASDLAQKMNVKPPAIIKWRKIGCGITPPRWQKLFPLIKQYLPKDRIFINDAGKEEYQDTLAGVPDKYTAPRYIPAMIPIISIEDAGQYDSLVESFDSYAKSKSKESAEFHAKKELPKGMFAIRLKDDSWMPSIPKNALVFVAGDEFPADGDMVMVKTKAKHNNTILAIFKTGKAITLKPIANSLKITDEIKFEKSEARKFIEWIGPVVCYEVMLRA